jgi:hypothetical protein
MRSNYLVVEQFHEKRTTRISQCSPIIRAQGIAPEQELLDAKPEVGLGLTRGELELTRWNSVRVHRWSRLIVIARFRLSVRN